MSYSATFDRMGVRDRAQMFVDDYNWILLWNRDHIRLLSRVRVSDLPGRNSLEYKPRIYTNISAFSFNRQAGVLS